MDIGYMLQTHITLMFYTLPGLSLLGCVVPALLPDNLLAASNKPSPTAPSAPVAITNRTPKPYTFR